MSAGGRPTKYDEKYCKEILDYVGDGGRSVNSFAKHLRVSRSTIYKWADDNKKFSDALKLAQEISEAYWEDRLSDELMLSKEVNAPLVKLHFANRFGWTDKQQVDKTSSDGSGKLTVEFVKPE